MFRIISVKLSKIKYSGDSVGRDIRVEIEIFGKFFSVDKRIKPGTAAEINSEIGRFETDKSFFAADAKITVIEKDLLFNDVGSTAGKIKINATATKPQQFMFEIQIKETRLFGFLGKRVACFEIILEAEMSDAVKYVPNEDDGWIKVILKKKNTEKSLPAYLKIKIESADAKREYLTILEGQYRGKSASIKLRSDGSSWLIPNIKHEPTARVVYSISRKVITLKSKKYRADDDPDNPWKKGFYDIEIPDHPHGLGLRYPEAQKETVWFRIGHEGERYLHPGVVSRGCISITETKRWIEIYNALIKARKGDFMSVGVLEVID